MNKFHILGTVCACLSVFSVNAGATIIDNGSYTSDTDTGLDWLDLSATRNMSYNDVAAQMGVGGLFEGWTYATRVQVTGFWDAFGGDSAFYTGYSTQNNGIFDLIAPLWGDLQCEAIACTTGNGFSGAITGDFTGTHYWTALAWDDITHPNEPTQDYFNRDERLMLPGDSEIWAGSALIRASTIPVPGAFWLFGSGVMGLIGMTKRKHAQQSEYSESE